MHPRSTYFPTIREKMPINRSSGSRKKGATQIFLKREVMISPRVGWYTSAFDVEFWWIIISRQSKMVFFSGRKVSADPGLLSGEPIPPSTQCWLLHVSSSRRSVCWCAAATDKCNAAAPPAQVAFLLPSITQKTLKPHLRPFYIRAPELGCN